MMTKLFCRPVVYWCGGVALLLSGCVDDSYDLNKIDKTMRVEVESLTIPLQFEDGIKFGDLIDISDNELVGVEDSNGNYFLQQSGTFQSEDIRINEIVASPTANEFKSIPFPIRGNANNTVDFDVEQYANFDFEFGYDEVDPYIREIVGGDVEFNITFMVETGIPCKLEDLTFRLPSGMIGSVQGNHGEVETNGDLLCFKNVDCPDGTFVFDYQVTRLNIKDAGGVLTAHANGDYGVFHLKNNLALIKGKIIATETQNGLVVATISLGDIRVKTIDGSIKYTFDDISHVATLEDLPDLLKNPNTHLSLANPQLYLEINNPFGKYGAQASTQIVMKQERINPDDYLKESARYVSTTKPVEITENELQYFVFSEYDPGADGHFAGASWTKMDGLGNIVYGKGMPNSLEFIFVDPVLDSENVRNFPIGNNDDPINIKGSYTFYAPLAFGENAQVVYTQEQRGWGIEDMVVTGLEITADVTSTVPVAVKLNAYPIVKDENGDPKVVEDIEITSTEIGGLAENKPVTIKMNFKGVKELTGLDGMRYTATLISADQGAIGPNQELSLKNLRINISGYYDLSDDDK